MAGDDPAYAGWIRLQPCHQCGTKRGVAAHHSTVGRGRGQKTSDRCCIPLCWKCHDDFHQYRGSFWGWPKAQRRQWQNDAVAHYQGRGPLSTNQDDEDVF